MRARWIEQRQHADELPLAVLIGSRHAQRAEAAAGKVVHGFLNGGLDVAASVDISRMTCGAPFGHLELLPVRAFDGRFGALMHRIERLEMENLVAFQAVVLYPGDHGQIDRVFVFRARRERGVENDLVAGDAVHAEWIA